MDFDICPTCPGLHGLLVVSLFSAWAEDIFVASLSFYIPPRSPLQRQRVSGPWRELPLEAGEKTTKMPPCPDFWTVGGTKLAKVRLCAVFLQLYFRRIALICIVYFDSPDFWKGFFRNGELGNREREIMSGFRLLSAFPTG